MAAFDVMVIRSNMLAENFGALLWLKSSKDHRFDIISTGAQDRLTDLQQKDIKGKRTLVVGGYYKDSLAELVIQEGFDKITLFLNESDVSNEPGVVKDNETGRGWLVFGPEVYVPFFSSLSDCTGFCSWSAKTLNISDPWILKLADALDQNVYGWPDDESLSIQNGICSFNQFDNDFQKLKHVYIILSRGEDYAMGEDEPGGRLFYNKLIERGREKRLSNSYAAETRLNASSSSLVEIQGSNEVVLTAMVGFGDSPIIDTCIALAKPTGTGILFRYNHKTNRTFITVHCTKASNIDAGQIAKWLTRGSGGGNRATGDGSVDGLHFPNAVFQSALEHAAFSP